MPRLLLSLVFMHFAIMADVNFSVWQVATDKCIMLFLFLIVCGVIAIIVVKVPILLASACYSACHEIDETIE